MTAFGISFPKLTLCRPSTSKIDTNNDSTIATTPTTGVRTLSLSIKNVPSQPLHYDVSTTAVKKKTTSFTTVLAIDGETKQLPKTLSVFNELQLDDEARNIDEKNRREDNSSNIIVPPSLSPMGTIDYRSDIRFLANMDSKKILHDSNEKEKRIKEEQKSNHTFTPPTSSMSNDSSVNNLGLILSSTSVNLPQLKYAIEKFLVDDDNPVYQIAEEFTPASSYDYQDCSVNAHRSNGTTFDLKDHQDNQINNIKVHPTERIATNHEVSSRSMSMSNNMRWYVSELRINRPLIYRTHWTDGKQRANHRKLSHSVNDLKQISNFLNHSEYGIDRISRDKINGITYSTLSLQHLDDQQRRHQSDDNIILNTSLSCANDDLNDLSSDEESRYLSSKPVQRTLERSIGKDNRLIRNESVKKKLFDILNDDELENACLEDMSQEFEKISITRHQQCQSIAIVNSISLSSDDNLHASHPNELHLPLESFPTLSSSCDETFPTNMISTTEHYFGRSRLITTSLDKIPFNYNTHDSDTSSSSYLLSPSFERTTPSWYTSPSPQWRSDDQPSVGPMLRKHSSQISELPNGINRSDPNPLLRTNIAEYGVKENKYTNHYNHHHRKEQKHISYSLLNTSTPLVDNSTTILPIIQDKSSNLLMFI